MSDAIFPDEIRRQLLAGEILRWTLSKPVASSGSELPRQLRGRLFEADGGLSFQLSHRRGKQEFHENLSLSEALERLCELFASSYRHLHLFGRETDYELRRKSSGKVKVRSRRAEAAEEPAAHDRKKAYVLPDDRPVPFLIEAGLMSARGRVTAKGRAKFRQINRYLEFLRDVLPELPQDRPIRIVDFGCGKSYLTFAVQYWLTEIEGRAAEITGLDRDAGVIAHCRGVCERLGLRNLSFCEGEIAGHEAEGPVDLVISLHACDTATDDALVQAVRWGARAIFAVPCCQHELAGQIHAAAVGPLLAHGILKERFAADATDALRALALEANGYRTQILEFIETEHTPKNLLIRGIYGAGAERMERARSEYGRFREQLGIKSLRTDRLLDAAAESSRADGA